MALWVVLGQYARRFLAVLLYPGLCLHNAADDFLRPFGALFQVLLVHQHDAAGMVFPYIAGKAQHLADLEQFGRRIEGFRNRSEEHTSELQSLMRISYAVFCLKKKK